MSDLVKQVAEEGSVQEGRSESFYPRGIGADRVPSCFVCGMPFLGHEYVPNISGFVETHESGLRIVAMLSNRAWLDYRVFEPKRIQVKVGVCQRHKDCLDLLYDLTRTDNKLTDEMIKKASEGYTGGERKGGDVTEKV